MRTMDDDTHVESAGGRCLQRSVDRLQHVEDVQWFVEGTSRVRGTVLLVPSRNMRGACTAPPFFLHAGGGNSPVTLPNVGKRCAGGDVHEAAIGIASIRRGKPNRFLICRSRCPTNRREVECPLARHSTAAIISRPLHA
mmetsp:Transcript_10654/g.65685  ORF Transcript_10654/g.65685 Transcript_10654/m.65685 type:complete len:139 (-) Transcript_10654:2330-2746(-)